MLQQNNAAGGKVCSLDKGVKWKISTKIGKVHNLKTPRYEIINTLDYVSRLTVELGYKDHCCNECTLTTNRIFGPK